MDKIAVWGLGKEFSVWRTMLESEELGAMIIAYCDKDEEKGRPGIMLLILHHYCCFSLI